MSGQTAEDVSDSNAHHEVASVVASGIPGLAMIGQVPAPEAIGLHALRPDGFKEKSD
jgi:hypothetical protein